MNIFLAVCMLYVLIDEAATKLDAAGSKMDLAVRWARKIGSPYDERDKNTNKNGGKRTTCKEN